MPDDQASKLAYALVPSPEHDLSGHPENAERFKHFGILEREPLAARLARVEVRPASPALCEAVHPREYLQALEAACAQAPAFLDYGDTYIQPGSYQAALRSAGGAISVLDEILGGNLERGVALIRPPGHHATHTQAMGFCLLNNVAIAARHAQASGLRKVMIVDFDVHHGNGTQAIFETDPDVLYFSTHQGGAYPGSGGVHETGSRPANGTKVNIPLPAGAGDLAFTRLTESCILPLGMRFSPDIILVSAGYDAHWRDPLASLQLSCRGYYHLAHELAQLAERVCQGRIMVLLEGGYDPQVLAHSVLATMHALAGLERPEDPVGPAPHPSPDITPLLNEVLRLHGLPVEDNQV